MHKRKDGMWGGDVFWWLVGMGEKWGLVLLVLPAEPMMPIGFSPEFPGQSHDGS